MQDHTGKCRPSPGRLASEYRPDAGGGGGGYFGGAAACAADTIPSLITVTGTAGAVTVTKLAENDRCTAPATPPATGGNGSISTVSGSATGQCATLAVR